MEALGGYRELSDSGRMLGSAAFVGVLLLAALLERLQFQLRAAEGARWWASNGRDAINAFALFGVTVGLRLIGFTGPIALAIAATMVITVSVLQMALDKYPRLSTGLSIAVTLATGVPVLLAPRLTHAFFRVTIETLF